MQPRASACTELGIVLKASDWRSEATHALRMAIKYTPLEGVAWLEYGMLVHQQAAAAGEAAALPRTAVGLLPTFGSGYTALASALQGSGDLQSAQIAAGWVSRLSPSNPWLRADWRHWHANWDARRHADATTSSSSSSASATAIGIGGIGYEANLQYPWTGRELRAIAASHAEIMRRRLGPRLSATPDPAAADSHSQPPLIASDLRGGDGGRARSRSSRPLARLVHGITFR